jgi:hypothetical protein
LNVAESVATGTPPVHFVPSVQEPVTAFVQVLLAAWAGDAHDNDTTETTTADNKRRETEHLLAAKVGALEFVVNAHWNVSRVIVCAAGLNNEQLMKRPSRFG